MILASPAKRLNCEQCLRPQSACICRWITPTTHTVELVVMQHPLEEHSAKGSARLLHLSLPRSRMVIGEVFAERELQALLRDPFEPNAETTENEKHAILLYPQTTDDSSAPPILTSEMLRDPSRLRLFVLDGTWRKSRKMLHLNPLLQKLPRFSLRGVPLSRYLIRKAHRADQLSTLEATCLALMQLEADASRFQPLLNAFDGFVAQQLLRREAGVVANSKSNTQAL
jgi:DTW domain-containing protein YfiP